MDDFHFVRDYTEESHETDSNDANIRDERVSMLDSRKSPSVPE